MSRFESRHSPLPALAPVVEEHIPPGPRPWRARGPLAMRESRTGLRRIALAVAGPTGMVGSALLRLLEEKKERLRNECRLELPIVGTINTRGMVWEEEGIPSQAIFDRVSITRSSRWEAFADRSNAHRGTPSIFLDRTAIVVDRGSLARQHGGKREDR